MEALCSGPPKISSIPARQPMFPFPFLGSTHAFSHSYQIPPNLRPDFHPTRPNILLLTYLLKTFLVLHFRALMRSTQCCRSFLQHSEGSAVLCKSCKGRKDAICLEVIHKWGPPFKMRSGELQRWIGDGPKHFRVLYGGMRGEKGRLL